MAGRIPQDFIQTLLSRIDIVDVIETYVPLKKKGANHSACCPFHDEKTPSFSVSQPKQFYYCFGCGAHGNAISFLMEYDHLSYVEAIEELAKMLNLSVPYEQGSGPVKSQQQPQDPEQTPYHTCELAQRFYQQQLRQHKAAQDYLKQRGLTGETAKRFALGFAPKGWDNFLKTLNNQTTQQQNALEVGLTIKNDQGRIYDRFRHRIMFPIRDPRGRTIGFGGRVIDPEDNPKYLNSSDSPIFHKGKALYGLYELKQQRQTPETIVIVEGYMDVIALSQHDIHYAVATLGTATTADHLKILMRISKQLVFCFDGDRAGREAAWRALTVALPFMTGEHQIRFLLLPEGEDPDSIVQQEGKAAFEQRIAAALPLSQFFLNHFTETAELNHLDGRAQLLQKMIPSLAMLPTGNYADLLLDEVAKLTQSSAEQIHKHIQRSQTTEAPATETKPQTLGKPTKAITTALIRVVQHPDLAQEIPPPKLPETTASHRVLNQLFDYIHTHKPNTTGALLEGFPDPNISQKLAKLAAAPPSVAQKNIPQELNELLQRIQQENHEKQLDNLIEKSRSQTLSEIEKKQLSKLLRKKRK